MAQLLRWKDRDPKQESGNSNTQALKPCSLEISPDRPPREPIIGVSFEK